MADPATPRRPAFRPSSPTLSSSSSSLSDFSSTSSSSICSDYTTKDTFDNFLVDTAVRDPLSASRKATQRPPAYSKKLVPSTPPQTPPSTRPRPSPRTPKLDDHETRPVFSGRVLYLTPPSSPLVSIPLTPGLSEAQIWERAISEAIDNANGNIDMANQGLTYMPPSIADLSKLVVLRALPAQTTLSRNRPFSRIASAPAASPSQTKRTFGRSVTMPSQVFPASQEPTQQSYPEIHLYLAGNRIPSIPKELFSLKGLTVLSLRANRLRVLPPCIIELVSLKELNVGNNKLTYLPAEILQLKLTSLALHPNPFLEPPPRTNMSARLVSPLTHLLPPALSLSELAFRVLLARPSLNSETAETNLEAMYGLLLDDNLGVPLHLLEVLLVATRLNHVYSSSRDAAGPPEEEGEDEARWDRCLSPVHHRPVAPTSGLAALKKGLGEPKVGRLRATSLSNSNASPSIVLPIAMPPVPDTKTIPKASKFGGLGLGLPSTSHPRTPSAPAPIPAPTPISWSGSTIRPPSASTIRAVSSSSPTPTPPHTHAPRFVKHAEERFEWLDEIAGVKIASGEGRTTQGWVPVLWRGCSAGCLDFLEEGDGDGSAEDEDKDSAGDEGSLEWDSEGLELDVPLKVNKWGNDDTLEEGEESEDSLDLEVRTSRV